MRASAIGVTQTARTGETIVPNARKKSASRHFLCGGRLPRGSFSLLPYLLIVDEGLVKENRD